MPWSETDRMEQRARFVLDALQRKFTISELCYRYGVSRKTGHKWIKRYKKEGAAGCDDRRRSPRVHPNATDPKIARLIIKARRANPGFGARTLRQVLVDDHPGIDWPCASTIGEILKRNDLIRKHRRRPARSTWRPARTIKLWNRTGAMRICGPRRSVDRSVPDGVTGDDLGVGLPLG